MSCSAIFWCRCIDTVSSDISNFNIVVLEVPILATFHFQCRCFYISNMAIIVLHIATYCFSFLCTKATSKVLCLLYMLFFFASFCWENKRELPSERN